MLMVWKSKGADIADGLAAPGAQFGGVDSLMVSAAGTLRNVYADNSPLKMLCRQFYIG